MITSVPSFPTSSPFGPLSPGSEALVAVTSLHRLLQLYKHLWLTDSERLGFSRIDDGLRAARSTMISTAIDTAQIRQLCNDSVLAFGDILGIDDAYIGGLAVVSVDTLMLLAGDQKIPRPIVDQLWFAYSMQIRDMVSCLAHSVDEFVSLSIKIEDEERRLLKCIELAILAQWTADESVVGEWFALSFSAQYRRAMSLRADKYRGQRRTQSPIP